MLERATSRFTEARVTGYAFTLAVGMWAPFAAIMLTSTTLPGLRDSLAGDFRFFYALAHFAHGGDFAKVYDPVALGAFGESFLSTATDHTSYPSPYPPIFTMAIAPLGAFSYTTARVIWSIASAVMYAVACAIVWRACPRLTSSAKAFIACAAAYPAFMLLMAYGQSSAPALVFFSLAFLALGRDRRWLAGLALGALVYKPQLALGAALVMLLAAEWKVIGGALVMATVELAIGWWRVGTDVMRTYFHTLLDAPGLIESLEPTRHHLHSLKGFFSLLLPWPSIALAAYVATSLIAVAMAVWVWKGRAPIGLRFSVLLLVTVLVDPHLNVYDLVVLAPMFLLVADWLLGDDVPSPPRALVPLLIASFVLPLTGPLAAWTHVQLSVIAMSALLVAMATAIRKA
jgi:hypothetical protein